MNKRSLQSPPVARIAWGIRVLLCHIFKALLQPLFGFESASQSDNFRGGKRIRRVRQPAEASHCQPGFRGLQEPALR